MGELVKIFFDRFSNLEIIFLSASATLPLRYEYAGAHDVSFSLLFLLLFGIRWIASSTQPLSSTYLCMVRCGWYRMFEWVFTTPPFGYAYIEYEQREREVEHMNFAIDLDIFQNGFFFSSFYRKIDPNWKKLVYSAHFPHYMAFIGMWFCEISIFIRWTSRVFLCIWRFIQPKWLFCCCNSLRLYRG